MRFAAVAVLLVILCGAASAAEPDFGMTPEEFQKALNDSILKDSSDEAAGKASLAICRKSGQTKYSCKLGDGDYKLSVGAMKHMNLINGKFTQKLKVDFDITDGKVSSVTLSGTRGDPPNLFLFLGQAIDIIQIWDRQETVKDTDFHKIVDDLGLMRGDDAEDIGKPRTVILDHVSVTCLAEPSTVTTDVVCHYEPRS